MEKQPKSLNHSQYQWQIRLLPVMIKMVVALTVFFFVASMVQLYSIQKRILKTPGVKQEWIQETENDPGLIALELLCIEKRYHQGNLSLMSRIWLKYLGFVTGMVLSLIGAVFILGKLREPQSQVELSAQSVRLSLISSSPGLVMIAFGTLIMLGTIFKHNPIDVYDQGIYINGKNNFQEIFPVKPGENPPALKDTVKQRPKIQNR